MYEIIFSKIIDSEIDQSYTYIKETLEAPKAAENLFNELLDKYIKRWIYWRKTVKVK